MIRSDCAHDKLCSLFWFEEENGRWTERVLPPAILAISKNGRTALKRNNDGELQICSREEATGAWKERCNLDVTLSDKNHNVLFNIDGTALVVVQKVEESSSVSVFLLGLKTAERRRLLHM